jgi:hypothetical protein
MNCEKCGSPEVVDILVGEQVVSSGAFCGPCARKALEYVRVLLSTPPLDDPFHVLVEGAPTDPVQYVSWKWEKAK